MILDLKKHIAIVGILSLFTCMSYAQVGVSTVSPDPATELHIVSPHNNTGVLITAFTSAELNNTTAFPNPTHGMLVYNLTENSFMYNAGTSSNRLWTNIGQVPAVENIATTTCIQKADMRYCKTNKKIYYCNGSSWVMLKSL